MKTIDVSLHLNEKLLGLDSSQCVDSNLIEETMNACLEQRFDSSLCWSNSDTHCPVNSSDLFENMN